MKSSGPKAPSRPSAFILNEQTPATPAVPAAEAAPQGGNPDRFLSAPLTTLLKQLKEAVQKPDAFAPARPKQQAGMSEFERVFVEHFLCERSPDLLLPPETLHADVKTEAEWQEFFGRLEAYAQDLEVNAEHVTRIRFRGVLSAEAELPLEVSLHAFRAQQKKAPAHYGLAVVDIYRQRPQRERCDPFVRAIIPSAAVRAELETLQPGAWLDSAQWRAWFEMPQLKLTRLHYRPVRPGRSLIEHPRGPDVLRQADAAAQSREAMLRRELGLPNSAPGMKPAEPAKKSAASEHLYEQKSRLDKLLS